MNKTMRSEEHTSELQSLRHLVCRLLLEKKRSSTPLRRPLARRTPPSGQFGHLDSLPFLPVVENMNFLRALIGPKAGLDFFFFNDTATTEIYTLSLHDALPI